MGRVVTIDGSKANDAVKGFAALTPGKYIAKIVDVKEGVFKDTSKNPGRPKLAVRFKIIEGPEGIGRQFTDFNLPLFDTWSSGSAAAQYYKFFKALGVVFPEKGSSAEVELPSGDDDDWANLLGEEIGIVLKNEIKQGGKVGNPDDIESRVDGFGYFDAADGLPDDASIKKDEFTL